jgi:hypothetical protein
VSSTSLQGTVTDVNFTSTPDHIASALQLKRTGPSIWRGPCPCCGGRRRFQLRAGRTGKPLIWCWGGCGSRDVIRKLISLGLWATSTAPPLPARLVHEATEWRRGLLLVFNDWLRLAKEALAAHFDAGEEPDPELCERILKVTALEVRLRRVTTRELAAAYELSRQLSASATQYWRRIGEEDLADCIRLAHLGVRLAEHLDQTLPARRMVA